MLYSFRAWGSCWLVSFLCCQGHWNYRSCLSDHLTICLSIWLSNENVDYQLENAVPVYRTIWVWLSVCLSDYRLNWKLPINDWNCRSYLPFFMSYRKLPTNDWNCRSCLPFMFVLPFLSTVEVLDACVNQYQYWSGKERSRGKDVLTFQTQFARLRDQSTMHFIRYTVSLFCCGVSWQTKPSRTMASISNSVHLDCSWETSYSQPFVPTWSAMLHVPQGNAAGQCYHLFFFFFSHLCKETFVPARGTKLPFLSDFSGLAHGLTGHGWVSGWQCLVRYMMYAHRQHRVCVLVSVLAGRGMENTACTAAIRFGISGHHHFQSGLLQLMSAMTGWSMSVPLANRLSACCGAGIARYGLAAGAPGCLVQKTQCALIGKTQIDPAPDSWPSRPAWRRLDTCTSYLCCSCAWT